VIDTYSPTFCGENDQELWRWRQIQLPKKCGKNAPHTAGDCEVRDQAGHCSAPWEHAPRTDAYLVRWLGVNFQASKGRLMATKKKKKYQL
jgi:hypothetical protein